MIGIRPEIARRIEGFLGDLKPDIVQNWTETTLESSSRLRFTNPLPGAVYARLVDSFVNALCQALDQEDFVSATEYWPELARTGSLTGHTADEVAHLCITACRSLTDAIDRVTQDAEDGSSVRVSFQRILGRVRDALKPAPAPAPIPAPAIERPRNVDLDALVSAAEGLRQGLAWSELYDRDIRRSRRLEALRRMLLEMRAATPAKAAEAVLRHVHNELPCRLCLLVRDLGPDRDAQLEAAWPVEPLGRELGETIRLDEATRQQLPRGSASVTLAVEHGACELKAELVRAGARAMFIAAVPRGKGPAGWLVIGSQEPTPLPADDIEFAETAAVILSTALDNALLSTQLGALARRVRNLVQVTPEPLVLLMPSGIVLDVSHAACQILGRPRSDLVNVNLCECGLIGERNELRNLITKAAPAAAPATRLLTARRRDGAPFEAACSAAALDDGTVILAFRNVTNVIRAAKTHREARVRYRALLDASSDMVFLLDREARCLDIGTRALQAYGLDAGTVAETVINRTPADLFPPEPAERLQAECRLVVDLNAPRTLDITLRIQDQERTFQTILSPVGHVGSDPVRVLGIARDVTEARALEGQLRKTGSRADAILQGAPVGMALLDEQGVALFVNNALADLLRFGSRASEWIGVNLLTGANAPLAIIADDVANATASGAWTVQPFEHHPLLGAPPRWLTARGTRFLDETADGVGTLLVLEDVTAHVHLQRGLAATEKTAAVGALMGALGHDFNTQLTPIIGHAQMLQHRKVGIGEMAHVNAIERCAQNARRVLESILTFARPAAPAPRPCDLNAVLLEACDSVERAWSARSVRLHLDLDPDLPSTLADPRQLGQVFVNLLKNAEQAMPRGGTVHVASRARGSILIITVHDTGEGIPSNDLERIFEPFYTTRQSSSGGRRFGGLGLTVAQTILRSHGGHIELESAPGRGTTVRLELPVRAPRHEKETRPEHRSINPPRPLRVLLIEPDVEMLRMMKRLLSGAGHRVAAAGDLQETLRELRRTTHDIIVADLALPGVTCNALHANCVAERPELTSRIVFTTAGVCDPRVSAFIHRTGCRLITKPFNTADLLAAITELTTHSPDHA